MTYVINLIWNQIALLSIYAFALAGFSKFIFTTAGQ